ncbi:hypothetical protein QFC19_006671 [Naganishia cerealis]|uniref:Uncharacterized protein n=1 Tax=Naganishia cerealis TaxID=610337 RepID=A0ACC2VFG6_9TREE|nr:hypothetical protein QFC19_006671 [Naganishia cerealis]
MAITAAASSTDLSLQQASGVSSIQELDKDMAPTTSRTGVSKINDSQRQEETGTVTSSLTSTVFSSRISPKGGRTSSPIKTQLRQSMEPHSHFNEEGVVSTIKRNMGDDPQAVGRGVASEMPVTGMDWPIPPRSSASTETRPYLSNVSSACAVWETQIHEHERMQVSAHRPSAMMENHHRLSSETGQSSTQQSRTDTDHGGKSGPSKSSETNYTFPPGTPVLKRTASRTQSISFSQTSSSVALSNAAANRELTSKGKKRKRLAKACSACHKNKRRCDGFAPCSNCEFSSRKCVYLSSKGEAIPPPKTREGSVSVSGTSAAVSHAVEASDTHSIAYKPPRRPEVAEATTPRSETSRAPPDAFKRPLPPGSYVGSADTRSQDMRRASQATASSVYSERPVPVSAPVKPWPTTEPNEGHVAFDPRMADHSSRSSLSFLDPSREPPLAPPAAPPLDSFPPTSQRFAHPSFPYTSPPRASNLQVNDRTAQPEFRPSNAKLRAAERQALFVEELVHVFFARLHPYQLMFHQPTFQYRRYLNLVPTALLHIMYALSIRFIDPVLLHDALVAEHATQAELDLPLFLAGEVFFEESRKATEVWLKQKSATMRRASWSTTNMQTWEDLEMLMAITLCGFYEKAMRRMQDAAQHFAHTAGTLPSGRLPSLTTQRNEMRLDQWWSDLGHTWGLRRQSTAHQPHESLGINVTNYPMLRHPVHHNEQRRSAREPETHPNLRYDVRSGRSEPEMLNPPQRPPYEHFATDSRLLHSRAPSVRDIEENDVLLDAQNNKKRRFSAGHGRPPYLEAHGELIPSESVSRYMQEAPPQPAAPADSTKMPSGLAALLTAAEHRGLK